MTAALVSTLAAAAALYGRTARRAFRRLSAEVESRFGHEIAHGSRRRLVARAALWWVPAGLWHRRNRRWAERRRELGRRVEWEV